MIANISYQRARKLAIDVLDWDPSGGILISDAKKILDHLEIESDLYEGMDSETRWSDIPDLAIIAVKGHTSAHAVVFVRTKDGRELIFDANKNGPVPCYGYEKLVGNDYLEIL